jgi:hypothetical protein
MKQITQPHGFPPERGPPQPAGDPVSSLNFERIN